MIGQYLSGRTFVFIDASNVYYSFKTLGWKIDFLRLKTYMEKCTDLRRMFYYSAYDPTYAKQRKFLDFLEMVGYTVRKKKVKFIKLSVGHGFHKGNLDVELTIDAVHFKNEYDSLVLFSGDSDFEPLIKYLRKYGKRCVVISTKGHISGELIRYGVFVDIKRLRPWIEMGGK